uniref:Uncharacterized protein n=1 Tax=Anopheles dirus TaxID=7168 RepID=A0A182NWH3_9DIPT
MSVCAVSRSTFNARVLTGATLGAQDRSSPPAGCAVRENSNEKLIDIATDGLEGCRWERNGPTVLKNSSVNRTPSAVVYCRSV